MRLSVSYNENGEPTSITNSKEDGHRFFFNMEGSTAVLNDVEITHYGAESPASLNIELTRDVLEAVENLPFVQAVDGL